MFLSDALIQPNRWITLGKDGLAISDEEAAKQEREHLSKYGIIQP